ncbi:hypothetical protein V6N13_040160 [Hibiscus sabdariffa]
MLTIEPFLHLTTAETHLLPTPLGIVQDQLTIEPSILAPSHQSSFNLHLHCQTSSPLLQSQIISPSTTEPSSPYLDHHPQASFIPDLNQPLAPQNPKPSLHHCYNYPILTPTLPSSSPPTSSTTPNHPPNQAPSSNPLFSTKNHSH